MWHHDHDHDHHHHHNDRHGHHGHHEHHEHHEPHDHSHPGHAHADHEHAGGNARVQTVALSFPDKLARLLEHWLRHNDEHVRSYREWAEQARENGLHAAAAHIDAAARATEKVSATFSAALAELKKP